MAVIFKAILRRFELIDHITIESELPPDLVLKYLARQIDFKSGPFRLGNEDKDYYGKITMHTFNMSEKYKRWHAARVLAIGNVEPCNNGSIINVTFELRKFSKVQALLLILVALCSLLILANGFYRGSASFDNESTKPAVTFFACSLLFFGFLIGEFWSSVKTISENIRAYTAKENYIMGYFVDITSN
jgi:hypothetical protein